jgi:hypothetical protein
MLWGLWLTLPSVALLILAQLKHSIGSLLVGATVSGVCSALAYRGSLQTINTIAPAEHRAEVVASYLSAGFIGNSIPIIGVGVLASAAGFQIASAAFAGTIAVFALGALVAARQNR